MFANNNSEWKNKQTNNNKNTRPRNDTGPKIQKQNKNTEYNEGKNKAQISIYKSAIESRGELRDKACVCVCMCTVRIILRKAWVWKQ